MLTEKNIIANVSDIADYFGISGEDRILIARPLYHCAVLTGEFLTALIKGAEIRFYSGGFNPMAVLMLLRHADVTQYDGAPEKRRPCLKAHLHKRRMYGPQNRSAYIRGFPDRRNLSYIRSYRVLTEGSLPAARNV